MIERMRDASIRVVLLCNGQSCYVRPELELTGLSEVFDDVIISNEEGVRKPARELYMLALDRELMTAGNALMVGNDEEGDIVGAKNAGIDGMYFRTEISPSSDPEAFTEVVRSFSGPDCDGLPDFVLNA